MLKSPAVRGGAASFDGHTPDETTAGDADYLEAAGHAHYELAADAVVLTVRVEADELVSAPNALEKVTELSGLRDRLLQAGVTAVDLVAFDGRAKSGLLGSSSIGRYTLRVTCPLEATSAALMVVAKDGDATLAGSVWSFEDDTSQRREAGALAAQDARAQLDAIAAALGIELGAPHRVLSRVSATGGDTAPVGRMSKSATPDDLFVRLAALRTVTVKVTLRHHPA